jgi:AcrR family transcriptional regulator
MNPRTAPLTARGHRTREAVLLAARELFETRGYAETTMSQIADAAAVSHGSVYTYFANKDAVLNALVDELARDVVSELQMTGDDPDDIVQRLELSNRKYLNAYEKNARLLAVVEHAATNDQRYLGLLEDLRASFVERAVKSLRRLQRRGEADRALDARIAGEALCGMVESFARRETRAGRTVTDPTTLSTLNRLWVQAVGLSVTKGEPR